jgi:hypothetical protein
MSAKENRKKEHFKIYLLNINEIISMGYSTNAESGYI